MAAPTRSTHIVTHDSLYLAAGNKGLQHMPIGMHLTLSESQAKSCGKFVACLKERAALDLKSLEAEAKSANEKLNDARKDSTAGGRQDEK